MADNQELDLSPLRRLKERNPNYGVNWSAPDPIPVYEVSDSDESSEGSTDDESREVTPDVPEEINNSLVKKEKCKHHPTYAAEEAMTNLCTTEKIWKKAEIEEEKKDPDDEDIDTQIHELEDMPVQHWLDMADEMEANKKEYLVDYLVATEPELTADHLTDKKKRVLIKWNEFALPTWERVKDVNTKRSKDDLVQQFRNRMQVMAQLESKLRSENPNFDQDYPRRWLQNVEPKGQYIEDEHAKYLNRLRAWEWRMNFENQKTFKEVAPLYVENWVDDAAVPTAKDMRFITKLHPSAKVADILANTDELSWLKCTECNASCTYPREHFKDKSNCCGVLYGSTCHYASKKLIGRCVDTEKAKAENYEVPGLTSHEIETSPVVECLESCGCGAVATTTDAATGSKQRQCTQMVVQRGRQVALVIFREDPFKGWGVHAAAKITNGEFVTEYVGEVITSKESAEFHTGSHYTFDMRFGWTENMETSGRVKNRRGKNVMRRHKPFAVDATHMGNEARYINHSCEPNLISVVVYVERHGEFYHRIAFFARKDIEFGEELSIDYFPNASLEDKKNFKFMFDKCRCGTASCKFKDLPEYEQDDADCESVDSFMSDDEEYERERIEVAEKRREMDKAAGRNKKEEGDIVNKEAKREISSKFSTGCPASDLRRNPMDLIKEKCDGNEEMFKEIIERRMTSSEVFGQFVNKAWCPVKHEARLQAVFAKKLEKKKTRGMNGAVKEE